MTLHIKDLNNALNASHAINMPVPMTAHMMEVMQELKNHDEAVTMMISSAIMRE